MGADVAAAAAADAAPPVAGRTSPTSVAETTPIGVSHRPTPVPPVHTHTPVSFRCFFFKSF